MSMTITFGIHPTSWSIVTDIENTYTCPYIAVLQVSMH
jgi:hypothetical protein